MYASNLHMRSQNKHRVRALVEDECQGDEPSVTEGVMQYGPRLESQGVWCANDMHDRNMFREG